MVAPPFSRIDLGALASLPAHVARPAYDPAALGIGIVHLGLGAFHRAHQAVFTDDAIAAAGGDWGILGVSLRSAGTPRALAQQDGLYTVELLENPRTYRVVGALRGAVAAEDDPKRVLAAMASPQVRVITLTVTEKGYALRAGGGLDFADPELADDLRGPRVPVSTVGWLTRGLQARRRAGGKGVTVISCDNLMANGAALERAVSEFVQASAPDLASWIVDHVSFPNSMVDAITPASDDALRDRVAAAIGCQDDACVQREPFAQWVIEDRFAGPRPAWDAVGVELTADVLTFQQLKLHVLNTANSTLAYLGLLRGHTYAHEAFADPGIAAFTDGLILDEMASARPRLPIADYWRKVRRRLANADVRHALRQIGEDGSVKLGQRVLGPLRDNLRAGAPAQRLAILVRTWIAVAERGLVADPHAAALQELHRTGGGLAALLATPRILPDEFRTDPLVRAALAAATPFGGAPSQIHKLQVKGSSE